MADELPTFKPIMLRGLTYRQAVEAMKATGCAIRRQHWCAPVLVMGDREKPVLDDEGEISKWECDCFDSTSSDWEMVPHPVREG